MRAPSIESFADDVIGVPARSGSTRAHFVGHSMGTLVCQQIAADRSDLVASLALFGAIIEPSDGMRTGLPGRARTGAHRGHGADRRPDHRGGAVVRHDAPAGPPRSPSCAKSIMRQDPEGYAGHCEALAKTQAVDHRLIAAPALLVAGDSDAIAPAGVAREPWQSGSKLRASAVVERSGHWLTVERPDECNRMLA